MQSSEDSTFVSFATVDGAHPLVFGIFMLQSFQGRSLCTVEGIFGSKESAMLSLEWPLIDVISSYVSQRGTNFMILEGPLFPSPIPEEATAHGFVQSGSIFYKTL